METEYIKTIAGVSSGVAMITVNEFGENSIIVSPGANARVRPAQVRQAEPAIRSADILLVQLEIPMEAVEEDLKLASLH